MQNLAEGKEARQRGVEYAKDKEMDKGYDWQKIHHLSFLPLGHGTKVLEH